MTKPSRSSRMSHRKPESLRLVSHNVQTEPRVTGTVYRSPAVESRDRVGNLVEAVGGISVSWLM